MVKRAEWIKRVEALQQSGLTVREYAAQTNVSAHALANWRWRLRCESPVNRERGKQPGHMPGVNFVEILGASGELESSASAAHRASTAESFEVCFPGEVRIRVPMHFEAASLRDLLSALGSR